ncbi:Urease accessory protein UreD [Minicystis rosea]|nr:Urease accessory protein UreD [Minicystis rosea]
MLHVPALLPALAPGHGVLAFARREERTVLVGVRAASPLKILTPKNHGHGAWAIVATFGGGLVDGDSIHLDVELAEGTAALLGTQASTKVYRCPTSTCHQALDARVGEGALLVSVPDPVACFATARYEQVNRVALAKTASLVLLDTFTSGRAARGERWDFHRYAARTLIDRDGTPWLRDSIVLDPEQGDLHARMGRFDAYATLVMVGPRVAPLVEAARVSPAPARRGGIAHAASALGDDGIVVRIAGTSVEDVTRAARGVLAGLPSILGDDPFARKW